MEKELILLLGPIGAGKTTLAKQLVNDNSIRISQDEMGRKAYLDHFHQALSENVPRIIIDRMNFNYEQRKRFIGPAREQGYVVTIIELQTPREICLERVLAREEHPTVEGNNPELANKILDFYYTEYKKPLPKEYDNYNVTE